jgi:AAA+ ATPase superfamily predicted ATPase
MIAQMIVGRDEQLKRLRELYNQRDSSLVVIHGRRRIGKSFLVQHHLKDLHHFAFEGIEAQPARYQIQLLAKKLKLELAGLGLPAKAYRDWEDVLDLLTLYLKKMKGKRVVIFLDEYQWMTAGRSKLTALLKRYWDNDWRGFRLQLILCGSISSFMVKKVVKSKALYGRISAQLNIEQLAPIESSRFFRPSCAPLEIIKYLLVFGGVPKYLKEIDQSRSFEQNLVQVFFQKSSTYIDEYEKIFYSQFKEHQVYEHIVRELASGPLTLQQIASCVGMRSGGGLKSYLDNLERAQFVRAYCSSPERERTKSVRYKLVDPFLNFYFTFVFPNRNRILASSGAAALFNSISKNKLSIFLGLAFENFCNLFAIPIAEVMGFADEVLSWGPLWSKKQDGFQLDLVYFRDQKTLTICEIKYSEQEITPQVIPEVELRADKLRRLFPNYSIKKALITTIGQSKALKSSGYFDYAVSAREILGR